MAVPGLRCCARASSSCSKQGLLTAVTSLVEHGPQGMQGFKSCSSQLWSTGSTAVAQELTFSVAQGIFPDQGSDPSMSPALAGGFFTTEAPERGLRWEIFLDYLTGPSCSNSVL